MHVARKCANLPKFNAQAHPHILQIKSYISFFEGKKYILMSMVQEIPQQVLHTFANDFLFTRYRNLENITEFRVPLWSFKG